MFQPRFSLRFASTSARSLSALVAPVALTVAITACGSGDGDAGTETIPTTTAPTAPLPSTPTAPPTPTGVTPSVTVNPPPANTNAPPVGTNPGTPVTPTVPGVPTNPNPPVVTPPPAPPSPEDSSEPNSSGEDTAPASSSDETSAPPAPPAGAGFYTQDGVLYDVNGNEFVMRGVNYAYTWFSTAHDTQQQFQDIAAAGANAVRVVLATGDQWTRTSGSELTNIISWAKANKLVAVLEPHDSTGYGESELAPHPEKMLEYWKSQEILDAITGQEAYVLVNIANEGFGNNTSDEWQSFYTMAVADLRQAGIKHTFVVDAPFWGQDWTNCMRDGQSTHPDYMFSCDANAVFNADPDHNTVFSTHMYDVYDTADTVRAYFDGFLAKGVPFLIGEFASDHGESGDVDEATIMALSEQHGIGYLGWSWSGNGDGLGTLDITNDFAAGSLTPWGERLINGENGLKQTSTPCTCFE